MAPTALRRLVAVQGARATEIESIGARMRERDRNSLNRNIIQARIDNVNKIWEEVRLTHADIVTRDDSAEDSYITNQEFTRMQGLYDNTLDLLLTLISDFEPRREESVHSQTIDDDDNEGGSRPAKLPRVDLPIFDGAYEDWASFEDRFTTLVHDVPRLAKVTKLEYLKSCLRGPAAAVVKNVATTSANYDSTWRELKSQFCKPRLIVTQHLDALLNINYLKRASAIELQAFTSEAKQIVEALGNLKMPIDHWDVWLIHILSARLDDESQKEWESYLSTKDRSSVRDATETLLNFPTFKEFVEFLRNRVEALTMIAAKRAIEKRNIPVAKSDTNVRRVHHVSSTSEPSTSKPVKCALCSGPHYISRCTKFLKRPTHERKSELRRLRLCFNCMGRHMLRECTSNGRCSTCQDKHHSLLHYTIKPETDTPSDSSTIEQHPQDKELTQQPGTMDTDLRLHTATISTPKNNIVILATAQVQVVGPNGNSTQVRALLDQGAEATFVSESVAQLLRLPRQSVEVTLSGIGAVASGTARVATQIEVKSLQDPTFSLKVNAFILPRLTARLPIRDLPQIHFQRFSQVSLADPRFYLAKSVDLVLGADVYGTLLREGLQGFAPSELVAQNTVLGWIVSGPTEATPSRRAELGSSNTPGVFHCTLNEHLQEMMQRFWTIEETPQPATLLKPEDEVCERLFVETHTRDTDGRYIVKLPTKDETPRVASETRRMALHSLANMHRRFRREPQLADAYTEFMGAYEKLGHMIRVPPEDIQNPRAWYLPHHAVTQSTASKPKIRVVFDASRRASNGHCLNDFLLSGPPLQRDLFLILLNWRLPRFVFTADIVKMFRQIRSHPEDRILLRIVWNPDSGQPPVDFQMTTLTYGTSCAPFLAIRSLLQLAKDEGEHFPLGARCLEESTYVDDIFDGADELSIAIQKKDELVKILKRAGFELDKWAANHSTLRPRHSLLSSGSSKEINREEFVKTLGVRWDPNLDEFKFHTPSLENLTGNMTKRSVLSIISRVFDPLGWLSPVTVTAKVLMQDLWILKCEWDASIPVETRARWIEYCTSLTTLSTLTVKRWLGHSPGTSYQLHGFSDASSRAYAAAVYLRVQERDGHVHVFLLAAKSKVAPVKTVSIPNLELCGAVLLVKLLSHVRKSDSFRELPIYAWSDSQIVLTWLNKHPCSWRTFVANRVSLIQTELPSAIWGHVSSSDNPADLATRGSKPDELKNSPKWWHGPPWLSHSKEDWPQLMEPIRVNHARINSAESEIFLRFSTLTRLIRFVAYGLRAIVNFRRRRQGIKTPVSGFLKASELQRARLNLIKIAQSHAFPSEIRLIKQGKSLPKNSPLNKLNPILTEYDGILRVGGRLSQSSLPITEKHPPILSKSSALSKLFVRFAHATSLHGGPILTTSVLIQHVWILGQRRLVKSAVRTCVTCQRSRPRLARQLMGELPALRVTPARPFTTTGLDYAGPFQVRMSKGRGIRTSKGYIALFVCFVTRAIHLELVSDLTSETFIAAYRRFASRRGLCATLFSDNASTFKGADAELKAMFSAASNFYKSTAAALANDGTNWEFIPPTTPHYGGIWEAGVKSTKHHLRRAFGNHILTYEEFSTSLAEIEACLNSRPLSPMSSDSEDLAVLTPAHFLLGATSGLIPDEDLSSLPENRLSRYQLTQRIRNQFWVKWSHEYLHHLQERGKWRDPKDNFRIGQLVLLRDDRCPPAKWPLGRVTATHPGPDGLVRVVTVKTANNSFRRHVTCLSPLSLESNEIGDEDSQ